MIEKFGDEYLDLSKARQITVEDRGYDTIFAQIAWDGGDFDRFKGETAKAIQSWLNPKDFDPDPVAQINQNSLIELLEISTQTFRRWHAALGFRVKRYYSDSEKAAFLDLKNRLEDTEGFDEAVNAVIAYHFSG
ncbi:hypothetical protein [Laspinema palackyanum]|uniref:hypothetical protein n=1 Tax=Laspinema palackyanum TaxID=3231601 RepID=UPI00345E0297|nr:hypothetical protein [Laspinema sp. D2c]